MICIILLNMMCYYITTSEFKIWTMNIFQLGRFRIFSKNLQKFEFCKSYILLISWSENIFKGIFLLRGSRRMGKSCQHILLCFLVHPTVNGRYGLILQALSLKGAQAWEFFARVFCTKRTHRDMWLRAWEKKSNFLSNDPPDFEGLWFFAAYWVCGKKKNFFLQFWFFCEC